MNIHLRGLDEQMFQRLKQIASEQNTSVNTLLIRIIREGLGLSSHLRPVIYHDLDKLAGTWSTADSKEFIKNTSAFEKIDESLWK